MDDFGDVNTSVNQGNLIASTFKQVSNFYGNIGACFTCLWRLPFLLWHIQAHL